MAGKSSADAEEGHPLTTDDGIEEEGGVGGGRGSKREMQE